MLSIDPQSDGDRGVIINTASVAGLRVLSVVRAYKQGKYHAL